MVLQVPQCQAMQNLLIMTSTEANRKPLQRQELSCNVLLGASGLLILETSEWSLKAVHIDCIAVGHWHNNDIMSCCCKVSSFPGGEGAAASTPTEISQSVPPTHTHTCPLSAHRVVICLRGVP